MYPKSYNHTYIFPWTSRIWKQKADLLSLSKMSMWSDHSQGLESQIPRKNNKINKGWSFVEKKWESWTLVEWNQINRDQL